jgi:hypothetical protein
MNHIIPFPAADSSNATSSNATNGTPAAPAPVAQLNDIEAGALAGAIWALRADWTTLDWFRSNSGALVKLANGTPYARGYCAGVLDVLAEVEGRPVE